MWKIEIIKIIHWFQVKQFPMSYNYVYTWCKLLRHYECTRDFTQINIFISIGNCLYWEIIIFQKYLVSLHFSMCKATVQIIFRSECTFIPHSLPSFSSLSVKPILYFNIETWRFEIDLESGNSWSICMCVLTAVYVAGSFRGHFSEKAY